MTLLLPVIVLLAFVVEATAGFGATIVTVTFGAMFLPIETVLVCFLPVNLLLSAWLAFGSRRAIAWPLLLRSVLPFVGVGCIAGMVVARLPFERARLPVLLGGFVMALSVFELAQRSSEPKAGLPAPVRAVALLVAGVIHGIFASAGPLVVWVASRELPDKTVFRATLAVLWFVLNLTVIAGFLRDGAVGFATLRVSLTLIPALLLGTLVGERLHRLASPRVFARAVYLLLLVAGGFLAARPLLVRG